MSTELSRFAISTGFLFLVALKIGIDNFEECPAGVYYAGQLNHMYYSKSGKIWVAVLSVPNIPHPDCLEDPCLPNLILAASIANVKALIRGLWRLLITAPSLCPFPFVNSREEIYITGNFFVAF